MSVDTVETSPDAVHQRLVAFLHVGAVCAVVGSVGYVVALLLHGDLPDQTTRSVLAFIAGRAWAFHHLLIVFCLMLWVAALGALAHALVDSLSWVLGRLGTGAAVLGLAVLLWHYNIDGPALEQVADAWAGAEGTARAVELERGAVLLAATSGMFPLYVALLLGLPFVLFGVAVAGDRQFPTWLGWAGAGAGGLALAVGATNFAGTGVLPMQLFVVSALVLSLWMFALGLWMWRRARGRTLEKSAPA
ncbi:MAG TPA: hypothetical protein VHG70_05905 [Nocardioidaceae bacterium]|nr:hypothetical protein [Nocardioidaceae bacterium]